MPKENFQIIDFGLSDYSDTLQIQKKLFYGLIEGKINKTDAKEYILIGEHKPVITLGRRAKETNILVTESYLKKNGIGLFQIDRGGDVTYHCPGQLIVYPVIDLDLHHLGVKDYVHLLEESVILLLRKYNIKGERIEGATGVWIGKNTGEERKICAIGIRCSRFCTMHGLSLNVSSDLSGFSFINPCGFSDKGVTSMEKETGLNLEIELIKKEILHILLSLIFPFKEIFDLSE